MAKAKYRVVKFKGGKTVRFRIGVVRKKTKKNSPISNAEAALLRKILRKHGK